MADGSIVADHAGRAFAANLRLHEALGEQLPFQAANLLFFLLAEDRGGGISTNRCCAALQAPRTTALRWIATLVAAGLVIQQQDEADRRITLLRLTAQAGDLLGLWLQAVS